MSDAFVPTATREFVALKVADQEFCVDIMAVRELRGWAPATPLPQAPRYVCGVINLRGAILPVIDLAQRLGLPASAPGARHVIIVVAARERMVGLLVDSVSEILEVRADALQPTPDLASEAFQSIVSAVVSIEGRVLSVLAPDAILPAKAEAA
jgi:purine-binding chemotaxis protein CheW